MITLKLRKADRKKNAVKRLISQLLAQGIMLQFSTKRPETAGRRYSVTR